MALNATFNTNSAISWRSGFIVICLKYYSFCNGVHTVGGRRGRDTHGSWISVFHHVVNFICVGLFAIGNCYAIDCLHLTSSWRHVQVRI
jgi:hypothetical protein